MLLAIDIGNTTINNGVFEGRHLRKSFRIQTYAAFPGAQYAKELEAYLKEIEKIIVVSVVPPVLKNIRKAIKRLGYKKILVVGRDIDSGVKNLYRDPNEVGQDRLVNARAAYELHGGESIVVDFGTAITIDVVNRHKEYLGGAIAPGVEISLNALYEKAYLLPKVCVKRPGYIIGKETRQSMINGAVYGFSSLCDGIVRRIKKVCCKEGIVIATGGMSPAIGPYCETVDVIDPDLTLKGLGIIAGG